MPSATAISSRFSLVSSALLSDSMPSPITTGFTSSALMTQLQRRFDPAEHGAPPGAQCFPVSLACRGWHSESSVALIAPRSKSWS